MKSLALAYDIFRGEHSLKPFVKRKLIAMISSTKVILQNKERLRVATEHTWNYASLNKDNLFEVVNEIQELLRLKIFENEEGIEVIKNLKDSDFDKLINILNSVVDSKDVKKYSQKLRDTAGIDGKIYNTITRGKVLQIPMKIINPKETDTVNDYFNGESGTELALMEHLGLSDNEGYKLRYYGQEINEHIYAIGELINFLITGNSDNIIQQDSLQNPRLKSDNTIMKYDVNISEPPFMMKLYKNIVNDDKYDRFKYGVSDVSCNNSDWVIANQIITTLNDNGKGAILLPIGTLFRGGSEERIRKSIICEDLIEAVVKMPAGVIPSAAIVTCWIIFNKNKEEKRKNKIQFIDITNFTESIDRRNCTISEIGVNKAVEAYKTFIENDISFILDTSKLAEKNYDLNAFEYIKNEELLKSIGNIKMTKFSNVAQIRRGVQVNKGKLDALNTGNKKTHYLISIGNIIDGKIIVDEADKIQIDRKWEGVYEVNKGDLLVTSKGTQFKVAIVKEDMKAIVSANLFIIRPYEKKYINEVLKYYLESEIGQNLVQGIIKGTTVKSIAIKDIEEFLVPEIDLKIQNEISEKIKKSDKEYENKIKEANLIRENDKKEINKLMNLDI